MYVIKIRDRWLYSATKLSPVLTDKLTSAHIFNTKERAEEVLAQYKNKGVTGVVYRLAPEVPSNKEVT